ncbi:CarD-like/TRCF domain protein [compost metagenome]
MYKVDDIVIYGKMGACKITDITKPGDIGVAKGRLYYVLQSLQTSCIIYAPVNTAVFMRPILSAAEVNRLIDTIPGLEAEPYYNDHAQELAKHYESALESNNCEELFKLTMSIHAKKQAAEQLNRKIGQIDQKFMKLAEEILFSEISLAVGIPKEKAQEYIAARVEGVGRQSA